MFIPMKRIKIDANKLANLRPSLKLISSATRFYSYKTDDLSRPSNYTEIQDNSKRFGLVNSNKIGVLKKNVAINKEWFNSSYSYDKTINKNLYVKSLSAYKLIKSYLTIYNSTNNIANTSLHSSKEKAELTKTSRNINSKILTKSLKKTLVSEPEIKFSSGKAILNLYILDNEKQFSVRKLFFFVNSINSSLEEYKSNQSNINLRKINFLKNSIKGKKLSRLLNGGDLALNKISKLSSIKQIRVANTLALSIMKKKLNFKNVFIYSFLKWILSGLNVEVSLSNLSGNQQIILVIKDSSSSTKGHKRFFLEKTTFLKTLQNVNYLLLNITLNLLKNYNFSSSTFNRFFLFYKKAYLDSFSNRYLKKQILGINYLFMDGINNYKFHEFLPGLKTLVSKLFDKKVEINFIKLKYLHLNTDIFTQALSIKLSKKSMKLLKTVKKFLRLIKLPTSKDIVFKEKSINNYKNIDLNLINPTKGPIKANFFIKFNQIMSFFLKKKTFVNKTLDINDVKDKIFNLVDNKWIKGVKLETTGRLTRRYTASRSVYKYKYKGNLKDNNKFYMVRGDLRSNLSYNFNKNNRRIGAFGVKGWISTK